MVEQTVWKSVKPWRLHKFFFHIELYQSYTLYKIPWYHFRHHCSWLRMIFPHHKPHFRRCSSPSCSSKSLQKSGYCKRSIYLKCSLKSSYINSQFKCRSSTYRYQGIVILHLLFRTLSI